MYESEHTKFMRKLFNKSPELVENDKEERKRFKESSITQKPYVYFGQK